MTHRVLCQLVSVVAAIGLISLAGCGEAERIKSEVASIAQTRAHLEDEPGDSQSLGRLIALANDRSVHKIIRTNAVTSLGQLGARHAARLFERVVPTLVTLLRDPDPTIRREAARGLGSYGHYAKTAVPDLAEAVRREMGSDVSWFAAASLGEIGEDADIAVPALVVGLGDEYRPHEAVDALRKFGREAADSVPALVTMLDRRDLSLATSAARALAAVDPSNPDLPAALIRLFQQGSVNDRYWVLVTIREMGRQHRTDDLMKVIERAAREETDELQSIATQLLAEREPSS